MLGVAAEANYTESSIALEPGDRLVLFTDGVTEARSDKGEFFGHERVREVLEQVGHSSAENIVQTFVDRLRVFRGSLPQADDITIVVAAWR